MATGTAGSTARQSTQPVVHYLRKTITYNNPGTGVALTVGVVPAGSVIIGAYAAVVTAFNGGGSDLLDIYITTNSATTQAMSGMSLATVGLVLIADDLATWTAGYSASEQTVKAIYTDGNADSSAGSAEIVITYIPGNNPS